MNKMMYKSEVPQPEGRDKSFLEKRGGLRPSCDGKRLNTCCCTVVNIEHLQLAGKCN